MKDENNESSLVDLGAISAQTQGVEPIGFPEEDTGERYVLFPGISETD